VVINGIIHRLGTGCQWRQLPERFGPWQTVHKHHMLWSADGTWERCSSISKRTIARASTAAK
jgi:transposase